MKTPSQVSNILFTVSAFLIGVLFVIINIDVVGRNILGRPVLGIIELISLILPAFVFLGLPFIFSKGYLISADLLSNAVGRKGHYFNRFAEVFLLAVSLVLGTTLLMANVRSFWRSFSNHEFLGVPGDFILMIWPCKLAIALGSGIFVGVAIERLFIWWGRATNRGLLLFFALLFFSLLFPVVSIFEENVSLGFAAISLLLVLVGLGIPMAFSLIMSSLLGIALLRESFVVASDTLAMVSGGAVSSYVFSAVPMFILLGLVVSEADIGRDGLRVVRWMTAKLWGGLGIATVLANALFAAITGVSIASAAIFSKIAYPYLIEEGYTPRFSVGLIAGSSVLGMLIPPSILLIVYGVIAEVSINRLFLAAIIPGLILVFLLVFKVLILSYLNIGRTKAENFLIDKPDQRTFTGFYLILLILVAVLGGIYSGIFTPTEAGAVGAAFAIIFSIMVRGSNLRVLKNSFFSATETSANILFLILGASMFGMMLTLSGIPDLIGEFVTTAELTLTEFTLIYLFCLVLIGMLIDSTSILLIMVPFAMPTIIDLNGDLIWFGIVSLLGVEVGLLTPPLGLSVFTIKASLSTEDLSLKDIFLGSASFAVLIFSVAFIVVLNPGLCQIL
ncbi:MAG: TRAP transporter large permease subunit [Pseudomonadota bacterium]|nr:TRAP transporter large permease subunit [Pseudomonadota bacterium]